MHGFAGSRQDWVPFLDRIARAPARPLYAPDLPGHGLDRWEIPAKDPFEATARHMAAEYTQTTARPSVWLGYSFGARLALALALEVPRLVSGLVLESVHPGIGDPAERQRRSAQDAADADLIESKGIPAFLERWHARDVFDTRRGGPGWAEEVRRKETNHRPAALARALRLLGTGQQPDCRPWLQQVRVPVLLVTGAKDERYTRIAQEIVPLFRNARHVAVPGVGHAPHLEAPDRFLQIVDGFLASLPE